MILYKTENFFGHEIVLQLLFHANCDGYFHTGCWEHEFGIADC